MIEIISIAEKVISIARIPKIAFVCIVHRSACMHTGNSSAPTVRLILVTSALICRPDPWFGSDVEI